MKKVSIIGTAGLPARYGGFETLVDNLVRHRFSDITYTVICSSQVNSEMPKSYHGARLKYLRISPNGLSSVLYDGLSLLRSLQSDTILVLGVSGAVFFPLIRLFFRGRIVVNIDGIEWKRQKWSRFARLFLRLSETFAVLFSDQVISDNSAIQQYVQRSYAKRSLLIEYGSETPIHRNRSVVERLIGFQPGTYALSVCRIEPENNIDRILGAFAGHPKFPLVVVGNWDKSRYGRDLFLRYGAGFPNIRLLDPIYESETVNSIRSLALVYIHGHSAGGTNPSLVEAMYLELPVIAFRCDFNVETTEGKCIYFSNEVELVEILARLENTTTATIDLNEIGNRMKEVAMRRYRWDVIAGKYENAY